MSKAVEKKESSPKKGVVGILKTAPVELAASLQPVNPEAFVSIDVLAIKYGQTEVSKAEVLTLVEGRKTSAPVPTIEPFKYSFARVEDSMIFRFAVSQSGDLLGFIYLEVPAKFKTMKRFSLDDWFPLRFVETEDHGFAHREIFTARICIAYEAKRKMDGEHQFKGKVPKAQRYEEMAKSLKQKLVDLNAQVDAFSEEGFKHLAEFEKKLLKRKARGEDERPNKTGRGTTPTKTLSLQKESLYKSQKPESETGRSVTPSRTVKAAAENCGTCEKVFKELSFSRKELVDANKRLTELEEGMMTSENVQLKRGIENAMTELAKDRKEFNQQLKAQNRELEAERESLEKQLELHRQRMKEQEGDSQQLVLEFKERSRELVEQEASFKRSKDALERQSKDFGLRKVRLEEEALRIISERQDLEKKNAKLEQLRDQMMSERKRIHEEGGKYLGLKGSVEAQEKNLKTRAEFLDEERKAFQKEDEKRRAETERMRAELKQREGLIELRVKNLQDDMKELEDRNAKMIEEKKKHRIETIRHWREKNKAAQEMSHFADLKKMTDEERAEQLQQVEDDFNYINEQLEFIEQQKTEYDELKEKLERYEDFIETQGQELQAQQDRFEVLQRQFFEKLNQSRFDIDELREYAKEFGLDFSAADKQFQANQRALAEMDRQRQRYKKRISQIVENQSKEGTVADRRTAFRNREASSVISYSTVGGPRIRQEVNELIDHIFSTVCIKQTKNAGLSKEETINALQKHLAELQVVSNSENQKLLRMRSALIAGGSEDPAQIAHAANSTATRAPTQLGELTGEIVGLCDASIAKLRERLEGRSEEDQSKILTRIAYIEKSKTMVENAVKGLSELNDESNLADIEKIRSYARQCEDFNHDHIRNKYDQKIAVLLEYIEKIRENCNFFDIGRDNEILIS